MHSFSLLCIFSKTTHRNRKPPRLKNTTATSTTYFIWKRLVHTLCCLERITSTTFVIPIQIESENVKAVCYCSSHEVEFQAEVGHGSKSHPVNLFTSPHLAIIPKEMLQVQDAVLNSTAKKHRKQWERHDCISEEFSRPLRYGSNSEQTDGQVSLVWLTRKCILRSKRPFSPKHATSQSKLIGATTKPLKPCNKC